MLYLQDFFGEWGYLVLFTLGFAEFIGVPVASIPFMFMAGALAASEGMFFLTVPLAVTAGAALADAIWFWAGRSKAKWMVDAACGLTSNPFACVIKVQKSLQARGPRHIFLAKFTIGAANLIAPAAGLAEMRAKRFFPVDLGALFLWATLVTGLGWVFERQVLFVVRFLLANSRESFFAIAGLIVVAGIWRIQKVRRHKGLHVRMGRSR